MVRKDRFASRADAEAAFRRADASRSVTAIALNELLAGRVTWLERGAYRAGLVRPASPCGGIVLVEWRPQTQAPWAAAYYLEDWYRDVKQAFEASPNADDRELFDLAALAMVERDKLAA
jgi:hypothetical protein